MVVASTLSRTWSSGVAATAKTPSEEYLKVVLPIDDEAWAAVGPVRASKESGWLPWILKYSGRLSMLASKEAPAGFSMYSAWTVSYTHLTLPTTPYV